MRHKPLRIIVIAGGLVLAAAAVLVGSYRLHRSRTTQLFGELVTAIETTDSVVALTFDDGPSAYTDSVLTLLRLEQVSATFFVVGAAVARHPEVARRIVQQGHELGNHSYSHDRMVLMRMRTIRREVEATDSLIRAAGGGQQVAFRPPFGKRLVGLPWYLWRTNRTTVLWTLEPDSWFREREAMVKHVREQVRPGAIILLHVELPVRVEERAALASIIRELRKRGYRFVTISELLALKKTGTVDSSEQP